MNQMDLVRETIRHNSWATFQPPALDAFAYGEARDTNLM